MCGPAARLFSVSDAWPLLTVTPANVCCCAVPGSITNVARPDGNTAPGVDGVTRGLTVAVSAIGWPNTGLVAVDTVTVVGLTLTVWPGKNRPPRAGLKLLSPA